MTPRQRSDPTPARRSHEVIVNRLEHVVTKRYRQWERGEPWREWTALQLLDRHAPGLAPRPISAELHGDPPLVRMQYLPGRALGGTVLTGEELAAVGSALERMHDAVPAVCLTDLPFADNDPATRIRPLAKRLRDQPRPTGDPLVAAAYDAAVTWLAAAATDFPPNPGRTVLARGDHNLPNFLCSAGEVRLIDFENAGRGDRCSEFAELTEHISARCTPDAVWDGFLDGLSFTRAERARLAATRRLAAIFWLLMLLPGQPGHDRNPPAALPRQAHRVLGLL